jgi:hypothetical protein
VLSSWASAASWDFSGSGQYLSVAVTPVTGYPATLCAWGFSDTLTKDQCLVNVGSTTTDDGFQIDLDGGVANDPARLVAFSGSFNTGATSTSYSANAWQHVCGVFTSATDRTVYLNGGGAGTSNANTVVDFSGTGAFFLGRQRIAGPDRDLDGSVGQACVWNEALRAAEVSALARGARCQGIRPHALRAHVPVWGLSPEPDVATARSLAVTGTSTVLPRRPPVAGTVR